MRIKLLYYRLLLLLLFLCFGQVITSQNTAINRSMASKATSNDPQAEEKKSEVIKCLAMAAMGVHNVVVDHAKDAVKIIGETPESDEEIVYQPDNPAPDNYIEFFLGELFTHRSWKLIESRLREGYHKEVYESIKSSQQKIMPELTQGNEGMFEKHFKNFAYKIVDRFYLPNYRAIFINNLYYHTDFKDGKLIEIEEYIKKEDLPLVIEALEGR